MPSAPSQTEKPCRPRQERPSIILPSAQDIERYGIAEIGADPIDRLAAILCASTDTHYGRAVDELLRATAKRK